MAVRRKTRRVIKRGVRPKSRPGTLAPAVAGPDGERFELVMRAVNEGVYDWDIAANTIYYSEGVRRTTGMTPRQIRTPLDWRKRIHPEDLPRYDAALIAHFKGKSERFECDYRFRARDGSWRWARQHGIALRDARGRALRMVGSTGDITDLKRAEQALKESEERYALATRAATEGIYEWNLETGELYLSERSKAFFAVAGDALTPATWNKRVHGADFEGYRSAIVDYLKGRTPAFEREYRIRNAAGGWSWVVDRAMAVRDADGRVLRLVGALNDITQRKRHEDELRRARDEATEALEQQRATADVLASISGSMTTTQPVFDAIVRNINRLFGTRFAVLQLLREGVVEMPAVDGDPGVERLRERYPRPLDETTVGGQAMLSKKTVQFAPVLGNPATPRATVQFAKDFGFDSVVFTPMIHEGRVVGAIGVALPEARPFDERQIALLQTFADQAVIAIQNVRLFNETREALEQQKASAKVLGAISGSITDTKPVFDKILESCERLFEGNVVGVTLATADGRIDLAAYHGRDYDKLKSVYPLPLSRESGSGAAILDATVAHYPDIEAAGVPPGVTAGCRAVGIRAIIFAPMLFEGRGVGAIWVGRSMVGAFTEKQIALLRTFADQAVIAIQNARLFNETKEALERQTATAEILKVIASSPTDVQPVFDAIVRSAVNLCGAEIAAAFPYDGALVHLGATYNWSEEALRYFSGVYPSPPSSTLMSGRTILAGSVVTIEDATADAQYDPDSASTGHWRRMLGVPMLREGRPLGAIVVCWREPGKTPQRQVDLLQTFADQAVIAIENVRLFNETKEALERQTATAEILRVIASSPADVQPVFDAIAKSARRLLNGGAALVARRDADMLHLAAYTTTGEAADAALQKMFPSRITGQGHLGQAVLRAGPVWVDDVETDTNYSEAFRAMARTRGLRSIVSVPMLREGEAIGVISVNRPVPGRFSEHQTNLLKTFADQAVIAIENVRLFNETREALERQTATAEILKVIAGSPSDVQPVFDAIVKSALRLIGGFSATVTRVVGDQLHLAAFTEPASTMAQKSPYPMPIAGTVPGAAVTTRTAVIVTDTETDSRAHAAVARARGYRSFVAVPMVREGAAIGTINVSRRDPGPFADREVALLQTFADQAVIAIENVRLFNETREALERQTATAEILKVISQSTMDVQPVLEAIVRSAAKLFPQCNAFVFMRDGGLVQLLAMDGVTVDERLREDLGRVYPVPFDPMVSSSARAMAERRPNACDDTEAPEVPEHIRRAGRAARFRSNIVVPLVRDDEGIGTIVLTDPRPGYVLDGKQLALLQTFADQAVIAIENVRLFNETKEALERQTATAEILKVIAHSPSDVQPVFDAIAGAAARLIGGFSASVTRIAGGMVHLAALTSTSETGDEVARASFPFPVSEGLIGKAIASRAPAIRPDIETDPDMPPRLLKMARARGYRSMVAVPMLRDGEAIGTIGVTRREAGTFSDHQIGLLKTFADQAVIAIENVRLFNETKDALERQTATGEILRVISQSPTDTQPVFDAIVKSGVRLFAVDEVVIGIVDGGELRADAAAGTGISPIGLRVPISRGSAGGIAILERRVVNIRDTEAPDAPPHARENGRRLGVRSMIHAPMFREGEAIGTILVLRRDPGGLDDKQIALLKTFADQAVIAIENVRLFRELQQRTEALTKSVGQLTALGEVGQAISSTLDLDTVLKTIVSLSVQLTGLDAGVIYEYDERDDQFRLRASENFDDASVAGLRGAAIRKGEGAIGTSVATREPTQVPDTHAPDYPARLRELLDPSGYRAVLAVPLLRDENIIGALMVIRKAPGPFAPEIVELLKTFATQSALAIQNARLFREIADKGKQLEIASRHKSDFLANMSHELRTPLNAIIGFSEVLIERMFGELNEKQADYMKDIHESGRHLLSLINDILDLSKIEAGRMDLDIASFDLPSSLANAMTLVRERAQRNGIALGLEVDPALGEFRADERKVKQILLNLLSNAVKFTPEGGRVDVTATLQGNAVRIAVKDSGIGIAPQDHAAVFEEFKQVGSDYTRKGEGTGLGLALTKRFVELHGGEIRLESQPGKGSTFTFTLPVRT